ncbi:MAG: tetratricopeptide repeat protein [Fimbriimonadaceae bacterium]|nr:tetratricopeptide repeat protein [Fimbriimonadaceae bacterium]
MKSHHKLAVRPGGKPKPSAADGLVGTGLAKHQAGDVAGALAVYLQALLSDPKNGDALALTGAALIQLKRPSEAINYLEEATKASPRNVGAWTNLGTAFQNTGHMQRAMACFDQALVIDPDAVDALYNRGNLLGATDRAQEAAEAYRRVVRLDAGHADALTNLAKVLFDLEQYVDAMGAAQKAMAAKPRNARAANIYGLSLAAMGNTPGAVDAFMVAVRFDPTYAPAFSNLAQANLDMGKPAAALEASIHAVKLAPDHAGANCGRARALRELGQLDEAVGACKTALELDPRLPEAHNCLGNIHLDLGQPEQASRCFQRALELDPTYREIASNVVMAAQYTPGAGPELVLEKARGFARLLPGREVVGRRRKSAVRRIGFVSSDLWSHPVGRFVEPLFEHLAECGVEACVYSNTGQEDAVTERLKAHTAQWRRVIGLDSATAAQLVQEDKVDVLVDLSGHTAGNRLDIFAERAAPVQVTWLGFSGTVGMTQIDALLGDRYVTPPADDPYYAEKVVRLDAPWLCFKAPAEVDLSVAKPPHEKGHPFTFGCLNHSKKVNQEVVAAFAAVMNGVPGSRIVLKSRAYSSKSARAQYLRWFEEHGIGMERVVFLGTTSWNAHFVVHNQIDMLLDPFPYGGATTTVEGLWMGLPVVTLEEPGFVGRMSAAMLRHVGHSDLVAATREDYVSKAVGLAQDPVRLRDLRGELRPALMVSPLCDAAGFARAFVNGLDSL